MSLEDSKMHGYSNHHLRKKNKLKKLFIILTAIFCLLVNDCSGKNTSININLIDKSTEDLKALLSKIPEGNQLKVDILNELVYREAWSGSKKSDEYFKSAMDIANRINYKEGVVDALCNRGRIEFLRGDFHAVKMSYMDALPIAVDIKYTVGQARAYNVMGRYYQVRGEFASALKYFKKSEAICIDGTHPTEKRALSEAYYGIGALYYYGPGYNGEAKTYFDKIKKLGKNIEDNILFTSAIYGIGVNYLSLRNYNKAKSSFDECFEKSLEFKFEYNMANAREGLGDICSNQGKYQEALDYFNQALEFFEKAKNPFQVAQVKLRMGKLYNRMAVKTKISKDTKKREIVKTYYINAIDYLKSAIETAEQKNIPKTTADACEEIAESYQGIGDDESALRNYKKVLEEKDLLRNNYLLIQKLIIDIDNMKEKERIEKNFSTKVYIGLLAIILITLIGLFLLQRRKKKVEQLYLNVKRMNEIGKIIISSLSVKDIIDRVYDNVNNLMDASCFFIGIYNEEKKQLEFTGGKQFGKKIEDVSYKLNEADRLIVHCFNTEEEILIGNYEKEYLKYISKILPPKVGMTFKSEIYLPLILVKHGRKKKIGVITVQSPKLNAYSEYQFNILKNLAIYIAIALDNANAYSKIEEQKKEIEDKTVLLEETLKREIEIFIHKDNLMLTVSHQYKTPISNIFSSAQILKEYATSLSKVESEKYFEKIFANIDRMNHLLDHVLNFGKNFSPELYDLGKVCDDIIRDIRAEEGRKHKIKFSQSGDCKQVKFDKDFMNIMINNILSNSIKYSPQDSEISLELNCDESYATIKISDHGMGIPEEYFNLVFERFHRGSNVTAIPGTGLGLAIVKHYTDLHHGEIEIKSELNVGTCVTLKIPKNG